MLDHSAQSGRHAYADRGLDFYPTSPVATPALLRVEPLPMCIRDPACGSGNITQALRTAGHTVIASDLIDRGCPNSEAGVDFLLEQRARDGCTCVVFNPPYRLAPQFIRHAFALYPHVVALLRLGFIESVSRSDLLDGGQLAHMYAFKRRLPFMHRAGWSGPRASSAVPFCWFVWRRDHVGPTAISRI